MTAAVTFSGFIAVTNKATTIKPENVTAAVTYTADKAGLTVTYEDVDEANKVVDTDTVTGTTDETGTYTAVAPKVMNLRRRISQHQSTTRLQRTIRITSLSQSSISTHQHYQRALPVPQPGQSPTPVLPTAKIQQLKFSQLPGRRIPMK